MVAFIRKAFGGLAALLVSATAANAAYVDPTSNQVISDGGEISVRFDSVSAGHSSNLSFAGVTEQFILNNKTTPVGTIVSLGIIEAGEAVRFRLDNLVTGATFRTGLALDNVDGVVHALLASNQDGSIRVSFEDLLGGGDRDYNDMVVSLFERSVEAPLAPTALFLLSGLFGLSFARGSRRREV